MNQILCKMTDDDAKKLIDTIIEVEACNERLEMAMKKFDFSPIALKVLLDYNMYSLKNHKALWTELLIKYIGEEDTITFFKILRFDTVKKVIFKLDIEGCTLCSNK